MRKTKSKQPYKRKIKVMVMKDWIFSGFKFKELLAYIEARLLNSQGKVLKGKKIVPKTAARFLKAMVNQETAWYWYIIGILVASAK